MEGNISSKKSMNHVSTLIVESISTGRRYLARPCKQRDRIVLKNRITQSGKIMDARIMESVERKDYLIE